MAQDAGGGASDVSGPPTGTGSLSRLPAGSYFVDPAIGVPMRRIFRDTGAPYTDSLRQVGVAPTVRSESAEVGIHLDLPNVHGRFPLLDRGFAPADADLKIGPLYFDLRAVSMAVLFSDNIDRSETDRKADTIAIMRLSASVVVQLSEGFRIAASGSFVYLPFEGTAGFAGFGLIAPYSFGLSAIPSFDTQASWDTLIGGWNVVFADDFRVGVARFSIGTRDNFDFFDGGGFDDADTAGRYTFRAPRQRQPRGRFDRNETDSDILYFSNILSATTERLLPGSIRLRVRGYHENLWYNQGNRGMPRIRDGLNVLLRDEHENTRFKPFITYRGTHTNTIDGINHEVRTGIDGPITDQLKLHLDVGWSHRDSNGSNRYLWGLGLRHIAGPYTEESLIAGRTIGDFSDELSDHITYRIRQILGPKLTAEGYASLARVEDLQGEFGTRDVFRTGIRLTLDPGPKTTIRIAGIYSTLDSDSNDFGRRETWTGRFEISYRLTDDFHARLLYQYQLRDSDRPGSSYDENLVYFSLTKYFR